MYLGLHLTSLRSIVCTPEFTYAVANVSLIEILMTILKQNLCLVYPVPPFIRVGNPSIGVSNGSSVVLECDVEAFPEPVCYWERTDGRSIDSEHKAFLRDQGKYKVTFVFYVLGYYRNRICSFVVILLTYMLHWMLYQTFSPPLLLHSRIRNKVGIILYFVFFF